MSDHIPQDIMSDIILRLDFKDLVRCRRVSKQWRSVIDDPLFIRSQLEFALSTNSNSALFIQGYLSFSSPFTVYLWKHKSCANSDNVILRNFFSDSPARAQSVFMVGSCHGLVCFYLPKRRPEYLIANPSTGERHTLSYDLTKEGDSSLKAYGFGYDELSDDYKVVRILKTMSDHSYIAAIYGVRSEGFFKTIPLPDAPGLNYPIMSIGVFFHSSLHWCIEEKSGNNDGAYLEHAIDAIDLVSNSSRRFHLLETVFGGCLAVSSDLNVGVVNRRLCLSGFLRGWKEIGVWVMEEYGNSESWNRIYCIQNVVQSSSYLDRLFIGSEGDKILLSVDKHNFFWACSMAIGEFVSVYSQYDIEVAKMKRDKERTLTKGVAENISEMIEDLPSPSQAALASGLAFSMGVMVPLNDGRFFH
ncbi:F-box protein CPR1 [Linum grandiflorum]